MATETPRYKHQPITMRPVPTPGLVQARGDYCWDNLGGTLRLVLGVPCKTTPRGFMPVNMPITERTKWNHDAQRPSFKSSIHIKGLWHGMVIDGKMVEVWEQ